MSLLIQGKNGELLKVAGSAGNNTPIVTKPQLEAVLDGLSIVVDKEKYDEFIPLEGDDN